MKGLATKRHRKSQPYRIASPCATAGSVVSRDCCLAAGLEAEAAQRVGTGRGRNVKAVSGAAVGHGKEPFFLRCATTIGI